MLGSNTFQVKENGYTYNLLSPSPPPSYDTFLAPTAEEKHPDLILKSPLFNAEVVESPQKRRLSPDSAELDASFKRRRNSSFIGFETSKIKFRDILKTPLDLFSRRKSISSMSCFDKTSLNESTISAATTTDLNQSCSSLQYVSTPTLEKNTVLNVKKDNFDEFKSPSSISLFQTPKHKSLFKKGFRKSFMSDSKKPLKNIVEQDPNCSIDDVEVSFCEPLHRKTSVRQVDRSFTSISLAPSASEAEGRATNCKQSSCSAVPVLTLFHILIN